MLRCLNRAESREFRAFFEEAGYTTDALMARSRPPEIPLPHLLRLYQAGLPLAPGRLHTLVRWFWIGGEVETAVAREFIPEAIVDIFLKSGVLTEVDGRLSSTVGIAPFNQLLIVSDPTVARAEESRADTVLWPNATTRMCSNLAMRAPVGRTLELGTGNGALALSAAAHSGTVVATDINPRAREFCLFNAALNETDNLEYRAGDAYEPVRGERFDLILCNPPFYITPSVRRLYSDNSMELDGFCRKLAVGAVEHLNDRGCCQMLAEWVAIKGQPWQERLSGWFSGLGCDIWVMSWYTRGAAEYALLRVQDHAEETGDYAAQAALGREWQAYFDAKGVEAIFGGAIVLRKRQGANWVRIETLPAAPMRPCGDSMRRIFDNCDRLETLPADDELLATRPALPASVQLHRHFAAAPGGWQLSSADFELYEGLPYATPLVPLVADFVGLCDGRRTLAEITEQMASTPGLDLAVVRREACWIVRRLAAHAMLIL
jgi:methylase of polypeptide subunit release factors